jgi:cell volume regulation protein A
VLLQGTTLRYTARWLQLERPLPPARQYPLELVSTGQTNSDLVRLTVAGNSRAAGKRIMDLRLPASALVVLIARGDDFIAPRGATLLQAGDTLQVLTDKREVPAVREIVEGTDPLL